MPKCFCKERDKVLPRAGFLKHGFARATPLFICTIGSGSSCHGNKLAPVWVEGEHGLTPGVGNPFRFLGDGLIISLHSVIYRWRTFGPRKLIHRVLVTPYLPVRRQTHTLHGVVFTYI